MKMFSSLLVLLLLVALNSGVMAQDDEESEKDFMELGLYGGGSLPLGGISDWSITNKHGTEVLGTEKLGTKTGFNFGLDLGHFLTSNLVVGLNLTFSQFTIETDSVAVTPMNHRYISPSAYVKYYFSGESNLMPFIKAHAGVGVAKYATRVWDRNLDNSGGWEYREVSYRPAFAFGLGGGLFYYTHDFGGLYLEADYTTALTKNVTTNYEGNDYVFGETFSLFDIRAGVKVFFGSE